MVEKRFLIIGAGSKAVLCDIGLDAELSLSKGILSNDQVIFGYVDPDEKKLMVAKKYYGGRTFLELSDALEVSGITDVIIASPDQYHYQQTLELLEHDIEGIFAEKPLALRFIEAKMIRDIVISKKIRFEVNYFRRFLPSYSKIKESIQSKEYGDFICARGLYDKGLFHNGSHMINLLLYFFESLEIQTTYEKKQSSIKDDPSYSFVLELPEYGYNKINLQCCDERLYTVFELELYFQKKVIKIIDFGRVIEIHAPTEDKIPSYYTLNLEESIETEYMKSGYYSILSYIESNGYRNLKDAVKTIKLCEEVAKLYENINLWT